MFMRPAPTLVISYGFQTQSHMFIYKVKVLDFYSQVITVNLLYIKFNQENSFETK